MFDDPIDEIYDWMCGGPARAALYMHRGQTIPFLEVWGEPTENMAKVCADPFNVDAETLQRARLDMARARAKRDAVINAHVAKAMYYPDQMALTPSDARDSYIPASGAFAMLKDGTGRDPSKVMKGIRKQAGTLLKWEMRGNQYWYDPKSWGNVVKLVNKAGGVEQYISLDKIAQGKKQIRAENEERMKT